MSAFTSHALRALLFGALGLALVVVGCDGEAPLPEDAGPTADAGPRSGSDAGPDHDAGPGADAGPRADAGPTPDAGPGVDAGPPLTGDGCGRDPGANDRSWTLTHEGRERSFRVHVPSGYDANTSTPLVLNFHGRLSTATHQMALSGMVGEADRQGFIVVHPDGVDQSWNGGTCCGTAMSENVDDVGFVDAMLDVLESSLCVDTDQVFSTGLSNGGYMSHRLACELSERIAAIGPVAGQNLTTRCEPTREVSVMHFHGTEDTVVPFEGFSGQFAVPDTMADWVARNGCSTSSTPSFSNGDVSCERWAGCRNGSSVELCIIDGGGHQWPGGQSIPFLGHTTEDIDATEAIWEFFAAHGR